MSKIVLHDADLFLNELIEPLNQKSNNTSTYNNEMKEPSTWRTDESSNLSSWEFSSSREYDDNDWNIDPIQRRQAKIEQQRERRQREYQDRMEKMKREMERSKRIQQKKKEDKFIEMYNFLVEEKKNFVNQRIDQLLALEREKKELQRQEIYEEWYKNVFEPIQQRILSKVEALSIEELEAHRNECFENYLTQCNRKRNALNHQSGGIGVPLHIIDETSYNPFTQKTLKYDVSQIKDPLDRYNHFKNVPQDKERLNVTKWGKLEIEATPYGMKPKTPKAEVAAVAKSHVKFDDFSKENVNEMRGGKKVFTKYKRFEVPFATEAPKSSNSTKS